MVTVIVAVPANTPVANPPGMTVATKGLELVRTTVLVIFAVFPSE